MINKLIALLGLASRSQSPSVTNLDGIEGVLAERLAAEGSFVGFAASPTACLYFVKEGEGIDIEYEVMHADQESVATQLRDYAGQKGWRVTKGSYGNPMEEGSQLEAPVYRLHTRAGLEEASRIGREIFEAIFRISPNVSLDVVP